jgi:hypothetical protein
MVGRCLFHFVTQLIMMTLCIASIFDLFEYGLDGSDVMYLIITIALMILISASVVLNWRLLRNQRLSIVVPRTSLIQYAQIILSPVVIYLAGRLFFWYDGHLSMYYLSLSIPEWMGIENGELGVATSLLGICMFIIYVFVFMLLMTLHSLNMLSKHTPFVFSPVNRLLLFLQLAISIVLLLFVSVLSYQYSRVLMEFVKESEPELMNTWNIGRLFFRFLEQGILWLYSFSLLHYSISLLRKCGVEEDQAIVSSAN